MKKKISKELDLEEDEKFEEEIEDSEDQIPTIEPISQKPAEIVDAVSYTPEVLDLLLRPKVSNSDVLMNELVNNAHLYALGNYDNVDFKLLNLYLNEIRYHLLALASIDPKTVAPVLESHITQSVLYSLITRAKKALERKLIGGVAPEEDFFESHKEKKQTWRFM